jgi:YggT family protein
MSPTTQAGLFLLQFSIGIIVFALMLRFLMRATYTDWRNPIVQFIGKVTTPICAPFNWINKLGPRWDIAALIVAIILQAALAVMIGLVTGRSFSAGFISLFAISEVLNFLFDLAFWLIIIQVILSWLARSNSNPNLDIFRQMTEPMLAPIRRFMPDLGGFDLSPIVAIAVIKLSQILIVGTIAQFANTLV